MRAFVFLAFLPLIWAQFYTTKPTCKNSEMECSISTCCPTEDDFNFIPRKDCNEAVFCIPYEQNGRCDNNGAPCQIFCPIVCPPDTKHCPGVSYDGCPTPGWCASKDSSCETPNKTEIPSIGIAILSIRSFPLILSILPILQFSNSSKSPIL